MNNGFFRDGAGKAAGVGPLARRRGRHAGCWLAAAIGIAGALAGQEGPAAPAITPQDYLEAILYTPAEVEDWLTGRAFPFSRYDAELGWLVAPMRRQDGVNSAIADYNYDGPLGARRMLNGAGRPARINAYGDSFTHCDQVSDGETWPEMLAAHLGEPVRNFGVGGYSVYQAYRRMLRVEHELPADLIILNIFEDDHYRNLDAWRNIRVRKHPLFIEPTLPHLQVDLASGKCIEVENPCPTPEAFRRLADPAWVRERFKDDFVLNIMVAHRNARAGNPAEAYRSIMAQATTIGINTRVDEGSSLEDSANALHTRAALRSTEYIVEQVETHARRHGKKVLYVLSYRARTIARRLTDGTRFDQAFVDFLDQRKACYVDLMEAHVRDFGDFSLSPERYVGRYFIGHYNPAGNFFTAAAIREQVAALLDPPTPAYRTATDDFWRRAPAK